MTFIAELAAGKGVDALVKALGGPAARLWRGGPERRVLVLLHEEFGAETKLGRDIFYAWQLDEAIMAALAEVTAGRALGSSEVLAEAFKPRLVRTPEAHKDDLATRMAAASLTAAALVAEDSEITVFITQQLEAQSTRLEEHLLGLRRDMGLLLQASGIAQDPVVPEEDPRADAAAGSPAAIPVPPQATELPEIAAALFRGPLQRAGALPDAERANELLAADDVHGAATAFETVAQALEGSGSHALADRYREWAAGHLEAAGQPHLAGEVLADVAYRLALRGSDAAQIVARRLSEILPENRQWIATGVDAMATWPLDEEWAIEQLQAAVSAATPEERPRWLAALTDVQLAIGDNDGVLAAVGAITIEDEDAFALTCLVNRLDARERVGDLDTDEEWRQLIATVGGFSAELRGTVWQRRAVSLLRRGQLDAATRASTEAVKAWSVVVGADSQAAEAFLDLQAGALMLAQEPPGWELRAFAARLQGSYETPIAAADRIEARASEAVFQDKNREAVIAWSLALLAHQRAGNFRGALSADERLGEVYERISMPTDAFKHYMRSGRTKEAVRVAGAVDPATLAEHASLGGPRWEQDVLCRVLGEHGRRLPEVPLARLAPRLLDLARKAPDGWSAPQPALSARRAVAATALSMPTALQPEVFALLRDNVGLYDISITRGCVDALILATNAGVSDESAFLVDAFLKDASVTGISTMWVAERIEHSEELRMQVRTAALDGSRPALEALAIANLAVEDPELRDRSEEVTLASEAAKTVTERTTEDGSKERSIGIGVSFEGAAMIARGAEESTRERFVSRLLQTLGDSREPELNRASAANAIFNLASAMPPARLDEVLDVLRPLAKGEYEISGVDQDSLNSNHPLSAFRINLTAPFELQACAGTAWARLVTVHDLDEALEGLQEVASANLFAQHERLIRGSLEIYAQVDRMTPPLGWEQLFRHPADRVRLAALNAWRAAATALTELSARHDLARDRFLPVRLSLAFFARDLPGNEDTVELLADDPDAYVRAIVARQPS